VDETIELGNVGSMAQGLSAEFPIWRLVTELKIPLADIEANWTFDRIMKAQACLEMKADYSAAWQEYHRRNRGADGE
jgi:hypothetical protein